MTVSSDTPVEWLHRIRGEYDESPGLRLTLRDAMRLWGLGAMECESLLGVLVEVRFLKRDKAGAYMREQD